VLRSAHVSRHAVAVESRAASERQIAIYHSVGRALQWTL